MAAVSDNNSVNSFIFKGLRSQDYTHQNSFVVFKTILSMWIDTISSKCVLTFNIKYLHNQNLDKKLSTWVDNMSYGQWRPKKKDGKFGKKFYNIVFSFSPELRVGRNAGSWPHSACQTFKSGTQRLGCQHRCAASMSILASCWGTANPVWYRWFFYLWERKENEGKRFCKTLFRVC